MGRDELRVEGTPKSSSLRSAMRRGGKDTDAEAVAQEAIEQLVLSGKEDAIAEHLRSASQDFQDGFRLGLAAGAHRAAES